MITGDTHRKRVMFTHAIRALLLGAEDGMTSGEIARALNITSSYVHGILSDEYGMYVDRWATLPTGTLAAVWMCVPVPKSCPRPEIKENT